MPILEVVLSSTQASQNLINRFNYVANGTPATVSYSFALISALGGIPDQMTGLFPEGTFMGALQQVQHPQLIYTNLLAQDIYPNADFYEVPYTGITGRFPGATQSMSPFIAYGYRTTRVNRAIGRGFKRFAGVDESLVENNGVIATSFLNGAMTELATRMGQPVSFDDEGNTLTFIPAICSKEEYVVPDSNPPRTAYRYYSTEAEQLANTATGFLWQPYSRVRSQTSRQIGRGI